MLAMYRKVLLYKSAVHKNFRPTLKLKLLKRMINIARKFDDFDKLLLVLRYPMILSGLVGHSLGVGLAILVSAAVSTYPGYPVIAVGSARLSCHAFVVACLQ